jgi:ferredoxin-thioredoxin reductase catalytic subunit
MAEKDLEQIIKKLLKDFDEYAKKNGFRLNPNEKIAEGVIRALLIREKSFGKKYCPCRKLSNDKKADKKIICPCDYHLEEIKKDGHCYCNLFVK